MPDAFHDERRLRHALGGSMIVIMWALYIVRITAGIGPMHDERGGQAPALHYLVGALLTTAMVGVWVIVRGMASRK
jgi:hypothetical protein